MVKFSNVPIITNVQVSNSTERLWKAVSNIVCLQLQIKSGLMASSNWSNLQWKIPPLRLIDRRLFA